MLFKSNGKFIDDITDSFNRFGIQTRLSEKGTSKNTQKFEMYDSIHDSGYVAVAVEKPAGKTAVKEWENIIENDLLPTLVNENNASSSPASALIVPSKDIDAVEKMLINKGLAPSVYQLFPGYVVAGINMAKKHKKPTMNTPGQIVNIEQPIHISNVALVEDGKPAKVGFKIEDDGKKVRIFKKTGNKVGNWYVSFERIIPNTN